MPRPESELQQRDTSFPLTPDTAGDGAAGDGAAGGPGCVRELQERLAEQERALDSLQSESQLQAREISRLQQERERLTEQLTAKVQAVVTEQVVQCMVNNVRGLLLKFVILNYLINIP